MLRANASARSGLPGDTEKMLMTCPITIGIGLSLGLEVVFLPQGYIETVLVDSVEMRGDSVVRSQAGATQRRAQRGTSSY